MTPAEFQAWVEVVLPVVGFVSLLILAGLVVVSSFLDQRGR